MRRPLAVAALACAAMVGWMPLAVRGAEESASSPAAIAARLRELKHLQYQILITKGELRARAQRSREAARKRLGRRGWLSGTKAAPPRETAEAGWSRHRRPVAALEVDQSDPAPRPIPARVNDPLADQLISSTQSEVSVASIGSFLVAAWNDGEPVDNLPGGLGYGYSVDGGRSWVDGGIVPRRGEVALWTSDPVVVADEKRGWVYLAGLIITTSSRSGLGVIRGRFEGNSLVWGAPVILRAPRDSFPDKPWIAADSTSGDLQITYTSYFRIQGETFNQIEHQRSLDGGLTWTPAQRLSADDEQGLVQGSRPAFGVGGEVQVVWKTIDTTLARGGQDMIRIRSSHDRGASFGTRSTVADVFSNFCSGPPGFNRGFGLGFPSIAVDRSAGPHRGRTYVSWEEPLNFYDDPLGTGAAVHETEPNPGPLHASLFQLGDVVRGEIDAPRDMDWFKFQGVEGQTLVLHLDSLARELDVALRLWCENGSTALAYSATLVIRPRVVMYTLPASGVYHVSIAPHDDSTGTYRLVTGIAHHGTERGRDHRDVFVTHSDDGQAWSEPVRINPGPPGFDAWVPEVGVAHDGTAFVLWYDWGDSDPGTCGAFSNPHLARSVDGGTVWTDLGPVSRAPTDWSAVDGNLSPNMGDYVAIVEDGRAVYPVWADGGRGDPDLLTVTWLRAPTAGAVRSRPPTFPPAGPWVTWQSPDSLPLIGTLQRRSAWSDWVPLRSVRSDPAGVLGAIDPTTEAGVRYGYRLVINTVDGEVATDEVIVDAPGVVGGRLAIERLLGNPARGSVRFWFQRAGDQPVLAELYDIGGRRHDARVLGPEYGQRGLVELGAGAALPGGLYVVRLTQGGESVGTRVVLLP